ncbi:hypothetical protein D3C75_1301870 [compost metagenome]
MAMFPGNRDLNEQEIQSLIMRIEREEEATDIRYIGPSAASFKFEGIIANEKVIFSVDNQSFVIITEED